IQLVELTGFFPDRPDDVHHFPVGDPFAARAFTLFALGPGNGALHAAGDAGFGPNRDIRLHATLPESALSTLVGRVAGAAHAVLIGPHVAIGHRDGVDVGIHEFLLPGQRVGNAVDVIPA